MTLINPQIDIFSKTNIGLVREKNEDYYGAINSLNGMLCVICDGMGGHSGGEVASKIAVDSITHFLDNNKSSNVRKLIQNAFDFANKEILKEANKHSELYGMGTTSCIILIQENKIWIAHIGDNRIYLFSALKKQLHRLTNDHSLVQSLLNQGIITKKEVKNHPNKNQLLKALGTKENIEPDIPDNPILPSKDDIFLLCTDGLWNEVSDKKIEKILKKNITLQEKSDLLLNAAIKAGGHDNITFQLVKIK